MPALRKRFSNSVNGALKPVLSPFIHSSSVPFTLVPWRISHNAISALLNAPDTEREYLVNIWKENKLHELGVVVISSSLIAGVIAAAFSWPTTIGAPWMVKALWYSGLFLSLISISTAAFFSVILLRLSCYPHSSHMTCAMLGRRDIDNSNGMWEPRKRQLYVWQLPRMMLTASIFEFAIGLALLLWDLVRAVGWEWRSDEGKILLSFMVIAGFACVNVGAAVCVIFYATSGEKEI